MHCTKVTTYIIISSISLEEIGTLVIKNRLPEIKNHIFRHDIDNTSVNLRLEQNDYLLLCILQ